MAACRTLVRLPPHSTPLSSFPSPRRMLVSLKLGLLNKTARSLRCYNCITTGAGAGAAASLEIPDDSPEDTVEGILTKTHNDNVARFMKMERKPEIGTGERWFPYLDKFKASNGMYLSSGEVLEALDPYIMAARKDRFSKSVKNRSYSVSLVVEGLSDFGNVSAAFGPLMLGFQSVHVVSGSSKRCNKA